MKKNEKKSIKLTIQSLLNGYNHLNDSAAFIRTAVWKLLPLVTKDPIIKAELIQAVNHSYHISKAYKVVFIDWINRF